MDNEIKFDFDFKRDQTCKCCGVQQNPENTRVVYHNGKPYLRYLCKECERDYFREYDKKQREENRLVLNPDVEIRFPRQYKTINPDRIMDLQKYGIEPVAEDEIFVRIMDAAEDAFISNYGRCAKLVSGKVNILKGNHAGKHDKNYTIKMNVVEDGVLTTRRDHVYLNGLMVETFIVNMDKLNTVCCYHLDGNVFNFYYKNIFPLTANQLSAVKTYVRQNGEITEEEVVNIQNDPRFIPDDVSLSYYKVSNMRVAQHRRAQFNGSIVHPHIGIQGLTECMDTISAFQSKLFALVFQAGRDNIAMRPSVLLMREYPFGSYAIIHLYFPDAS